MERFPVAEAANLGPGEKVVTQIRGRPVVIVNVDGELCALGGICAHQSGPLHKGGVFDEFQARVLDGGKVQEYIASKGTVLACPWHGWEYDVRTGKCLWNERYRVATYRVERSSDGQVVVVM